MIFFIRKLAHVFDNEMTDTALTLALIAVALAIVIIALTAKSKLVKAVTLAYALLP